MSSANSNSNSANSSSSSSSSENSAPRNVTDEAAAAERRRMLEAWKCDREAKHVASSSNISSSTTTATSSTTTLASASKPKPEFVEPKTPTAHLAQRIRTLNLRTEASPAVKLGQRLQTMRSVHEPPTGPYRVLPNDSISASMQPLPMLPAQLPQTPLRALPLLELPVHDRTPIPMSKRRPQTTTPAKPRQPKVLLRGRVLVQIVRRSTGAVMDSFEVYVSDNKAVRKAMAKPIFTLESAAKLAKTSQAEAANAVFTILAADVANQKDALFWITWARFEEMQDHAEAVMELYKRAAAAGAQPAADLQRGLQHYQLRARDKVEMLIEQQPMNMELPDTPPQFIPGADDDMHNSAPTPMSSPRLHHLDDLANEPTPPMLVPSLSSSAPATEFEDIKPMRLMFDDVPAGVDQDATPVRKRGSKAAAVTSSDAQPSINSSRIRLAAITPSKQMRDALAADLIVTPVRRSTRTTARPRPEYLQPHYLAVDSVDQIPESVDYAYVPNKALPVATRNRSNAATTSRTPQTQRVRSDQVDQLVSVMSTSKRSTRSNAPHPEQESNENVEQ